MKTNEVGCELSGTPPSAGHHNLKSEISDPKSKSPIRKQDRSRTGRIARLPKAKRDLVNQMLQDGAPYKKIIDALDKKGEPGITSANLMYWRKGGYRDWLQQQERVEGMQKRSDRILQFLKNNPGTDLNEAGLKLAASHLFEVLDHFDLEPLKELLKSDPTNFPDIANCLAKLSKSTLDLEKFKEAIAEEKRKLEAEVDKKKPKRALTRETITKMEKALKLL